jgi:IclR family transcriptional regulator, pca regulon regulatory protein
MPKTSSMGRGVTAVLAVGARHAEGHSGGTVADIAADLGKDRSQVSRNLRSGEQEGFLSRSNQRTYRLDWSVLTDAQLLTERR